MRHFNFCFYALTAVLLFGGTAFLNAADDKTGNTNQLPPNLVSLVEADWAFQESQKNRDFSDPEAIGDLLKRYSQLADNLDKDGPEINPAAIGKMSKDQRVALYKKLRWQLRDLAFENPLFADLPLVFMKRNRFVCQMLHEYAGYYYENTGTSGGSVCVLEKPGYSLDVRNLTEGKFPDGAYTTLSLSYDAKDVYFAFTEVSQSPERPRNVKWSQLGGHNFHDNTMTFLGQKEGKFQIYKMSIDGKSLEKLTDDVHDNFDPQQLPDGGIAFLSTRRGGFIRCNNVWEPLVVYTLHRMAANGDDIRTLSWHETNEWHPTVLNDGRIVYSRWDYVDRSAAHYHGLWTSHPNGTQASVLFGNYTQKVSACYQPRAIPGSQKIMFIAGAHHANTGGSLVILDPTKTSYHPETAEDQLDSLERITPDVDFPETPNQWPSTYYHSPWPLSEDHYLVSYSREPLGCFGAGSDETGRTGIYYLDRFGNLELLYEDANISCQYPTPIASRDVPPVIPDSLEKTSDQTGTFYLSDVRNSFAKLPDNRSIVELRVFELLPKWPDWVANVPRLGHANAENARKFLGTVPVHDDGSAYFTAPANTPIYFQAVDAEGKAVQTMRSAVYLQPGENRSCVGCHEPLHSSPQPLLKVNHQPAEIATGPLGAESLHYTQLIQPILDQRCVSCHDGTPGDGKGRTNLQGSPGRHFSRSYESLRPYLRWYEWGDNSIQQSTTLPAQCGADESPLTAILLDENHRGKMGLSEEELRRIYLWLDANASFYGDFENNELSATR